MPWLLVLSKYELISNVYECDAIDHFFIATIGLRQTIMSHRGQVKLWIPNNIRRPIIENFFSRQFIFMVFFLSIASDCEIAWYCCHTAICFNRHQYIYILPFNAKRQLIGQLISTSIMNKSPSELILILVNDEEKKQIYISI